MFLQLDVGTKWNNAKTVYANRYPNIEEIILNEAIELSPPTTGVAPIRGLFEDCVKLSNATFGKCTTINAATFKNTAFKYINVSNQLGNNLLSIPELTTIGPNAFEHCISLTGGVLNKVTSIGASAFKDCYNLEYLDS